MGKVFILRKTLLTALMLLPLPFISATASAATSAPDQKWIKIEMLIFQQADSKPKSTELWPKHPGMPQLRQGITLTPWQEPVEPYTMLPKEQWQLNDSELALDRHGHYQILGHLAWIQPRQSKKVTQQVQVIPDDLSPDESPLIGLASVSYSRFPHLSFDLLLKNFAEPLQPEHNGEPDESPSSGHELGHYFSDDSDLSAQPIEQDNRFAPELYQSYRFKDSVRLTLNKLHYLDHPIMGVLVQVSPFKLTGSMVAEAESAEKSMRSDNDSAESTADAVKKEKPTEQPAQDFGYM